MLKKLKDFAAAHAARRAGRRTASLIESLGSERQKDIGWRWAPRERGQAAPGALDYHLL